MYTQPWPCVRADSAQGLSVYPGQAVHPLHDRLHIPLDLVHVAQVDWVELVRAEQAVQLHRHGVDPLAVHQDVRVFAIVRLL